MQPSRNTLSLETATRIRILRAKPPEDSGITLIRHRHGIDTLAPARCFPPRLLIRIGFAFCVRKETNHVMGFVPAGEIAGSPHTESNTSK